MILIIMMIPMILMTQKKINKNIDDSDDSDDSDNTDDYESEQHILSTLDTLLKINDKDIFSIQFDKYMFETLKLKDLIDKNSENGKWFLPECNLDILDGLCLLYRIFDVGTKMHLEYFLDKYNPKVSTSIGYNGMEIGLKVQH